MSSNVQTPTHEQGLTDADLKNSETQRKHSDGHLECPQFAGQQGNSGCIFATTIPGHYVGRHLKT